MVRCNPCYNGYHVHVLLYLENSCVRCNPCYNGYHVHGNFTTIMSTCSCNPCYNGYHVHVFKTILPMNIVVILVIMDIMYMLR